MSVTAPQRLEYIHIGWYLDRLIHSVIQSIIIALAYRSMLISNGRVYILHFPSASRMFCFLLCLSLSLSTAVGHPRAHRPFKSGHKKGSKSSPPIRLSSSAASSGSWVYLLITKSPCFKSDLAITNNLGRRNCDWGWGNLSMCSHRSSLANQHRRRRGVIWMNVW